MVWLTRFLSGTMKFRKVRKHLRGTLIDSTRLHCIGGGGGNGFPKYGGVGGQGGCVYCIGEENVNLKSVILNYPSKTIAAKHGENSVKKKIIGSPGEDTIIPVPLGITIYSEHVPIGEINEVGDTCILARGGPGGSKTNEFLGREGQARTVVLDLKLIADVGFVGFPNAGKSTLLKALSRAKPRIAAYPFTTIMPNLGTIIFPDFRQITLADLPGLIEGAHINIGMGHKFLKHVERTKLLLLVADVQGFQLTPRHIMRSCFETVLLLNRELELYNPELLSKPAMLVINKMDTENANELFIETKEKLKNAKEFAHVLTDDLRPTEFLEFEDILGISAINNGDDVKSLKNTIRTLLDLNEEEKSNEEIIDGIRDRIREKGPALS
ncbi:GTP-binding protein 10 homolog [Arctopsyche grandis]|uniref:GTP-binding protein 10 homolog n=1 Tax=Arctopsyche grandis TaxID=121162 RepID=UPI00406D8672